MQKPLARVIHVLGLIASILLSRNARAVTLEWTASPEASQPGVLSNYKIYYSTVDFSAPSTVYPPIIPLSVIVPLESTTAVIPDLTPGLTYFFAIVAVGIDNTESDYSNVASFTAPNPEGQTDPRVEMDLLGFLPRLWMNATNGQAVIQASGAVGATLVIESSTNPSMADSWVTVTNLELTASAPTANPSPQSILEQIFVPSVEFFQEAASLDETLRFYRMHMPFGFEIAANRALARQDVYSRLIAVRAPGAGVKLVCYLPSEGAYLDYNDRTRFVKLEYCGPTIREVANRVAARLGLNWTSASEFTVTDEGAKLLFATVVRTDDPATDLPLGIPSSLSSELITDF